HARLQAAAASAARSLDNAARAEATVDPAEASAADERKDSRRNGRALDPLVTSVGAPQVQGGESVFGDAWRRALQLAPGEHLVVASDAGGDRKLYALIRDGGAVSAAQLDLVGLAADVPRLAAARYPRERAVFRLLPPPARTAPLATLRRLLEEVAPPSGRATVVARLPL